MSQKRRPVPTPEQIKKVREQMLADPYTKQIADTCGMSLELFVDGSMKFFENPNLEPQYRYIPDNQLRKLGYKPPTLQDVKNIVMGIINARSMTSKSKFADPESQREKVAGKIPLPPAANAQQYEINKDLKDELAKARELERQKTTKK